MNLDLYAGSISRYLIGDFDPDASPWRAPDAGGDVLAVDDELLELAHARAKGWRDKLNSALMGKVDRPVAWDDGPSRPFLARQPDVSVRRALVLWAAYLARRDLERPLVLPEEITTDPAYAEAPSKNYYLGAMAVFECQVFAPSDENFIVPFEHPAGYPAIITSTSNLRFYLDELNAASWNASPETVADWLKAPSAGTGEDALLASAREGFALFDLICRFAEAEGAPILVSS